MPRPSADILESCYFSELDVARFWAKVASREPDSCWLWIGSTNAQGYGQFRWGGKVRRAHRWSYVLANGTVDAEMVIDHLCRIPACVNPDHLEAVPHKTNVSRGIPRASKITECTRGHAYDEPNTGWYEHPRTGERERFCRACKREKRKEWRERSPENAAKDRAYAVEYRKLETTKAAARERNNRARANWSPEKRQAHIEYMRAYYRRKKAERAESA